MRKSKKLVAAIVGCGNIAGGYDQLMPHPKHIWTHAKAYKKNRHVELAAAYDTDKRKCQSFCETWKIPTAYTSISQMMRQTRPDIVSICSPNDAHYKNILEVLRFPPRAIICEKPLAMSLKEAKKMLHACHKKGVFLAVNYLRNWDDECLSLEKKVLAANNQVQAIRVLYTKGLFHNASHFIYLCLSWFGNVTGIKIVRHHLTAKNDLVVDFELSFQHCPKVLFQSCPESWYDLTEVDILTKKFRAKILRGGREISYNKVIPSPYSANGMLSPKEKVKNGSIYWATGNMVSDVVRAVLQKKAPIENANTALKTIEVCEQIKVLINKDKK